MTAEENAARIRSGYEAFSKGDTGTVLELFSPDIRWHIPGRSPLAGTYTGHDEVMGFFGRLFELSGGTFKVELHDVLASDDHVVVLASETASRDGKELVANDVHVWHMKDGRATEYWGCPQDSYDVDEFWS